MGLTEKLTQIKSEIDSLITYGNGITGDSDARIGDVVKALADGFGSGGSGDSWELIGSEEWTVNLARDTDFLTIAPTATAASSKNAKAIVNNVKTIEYIEPIDLADYIVLNVEVAFVRPVYKTGNYAPRQAYTKVINAMMHRYIIMSNGEPSPSSGGTMEIVCNNVAYSEVIAQNGTLATNATYTYGVSGSAIHGTYGTSITPTSDIKTQFTNRYVRRQSYTQNAITVRVNNNVSTFDAINDIDAENTNIEYKVYAFKKKRGHETSFFEHILESIYKDGTNI